MKTDRPTISLIIPTISRPSLARAMLSVRRQEWWPGDEVLLIGDGPQPQARAMWNQLHLPGQFIEVSRTPQPDWGHTPRNQVHSLARAQYLMALDDDDELTDGAVAIVRAALAERPMTPHIFRMVGCPVVGDCWKVKEIREGNVGTPMFVTPNCYDKLGYYTSRYGGDHDFIKSTVAKFGEVVWRDEVICRVRPQNL